ncbi:hypothetical protein A2276_04305 [candidate division WOR-1 bacterium RIFOXYA12_FULL_43_27]|uniref:Permease n=1 Tax=candidate division WOR-1 bacterium RIFOXYC2_FULL_46_14 TaxID=1802587 RepID=A0A1F4U302_UNCSA|nr:MAG: hypothetical protein A2276_04305 [candidate division WOR-1 bacterium RIFOXYA12_FULL_43_27]OGC19087.1 MAG: hypothetical protein A2292_00030 [candidate division WOR-1 bacterium RIFOXYB2_FULL_46_45]OGC30075.1 MAG: hypothetical protein A2232_00030 [candidate division WOR-1 bacterium RIFOXYA2_FULL_46_56]OGC39316.1 MAG: hypothetical protein A2438_00030 [candidate division WOR-1 bacterium RIFOXYC2_FULL_46_14]
MWKILDNFFLLLRETIFFLPLMFLLIGLFDVWVPREKIERHIGYGSGLAGMFWVILLAVAQPGPLYGAFPVAYILYTKGASVRNIFIYLGAFSCMAIPMYAFEIGFLGVKFWFLRLIFSLLVFVSIGFIMERFVGEDFRVREGR